MSCGNGTQTRHVWCQSKIISKSIEVHPLNCFLYNNIKPIDKKICIQKLCLTSTKNKTRKNLLQNFEELQNITHRWNTTKLNMDICENCTIQNHLFKQKIPLHFFQKLYSKTTFNSNLKIVPNKANWKKIFQKTQNHTLKKSSEQNKSTFYLYHNLNQQKQRKRHWQRKGNFSYFLR